MFFSLTALLTTVLLLTSALATPINSTDLVAREKYDNRDAKIKMEAWGSVDCTGVMSLINIQYNNQMTGTFRSYTLSRDMKDGEVFDFSTGPGETFSSLGFGNQKRDYMVPDMPSYTVPSQCTMYDQSAAPLTKGKTCWTLDKDLNCGRFWHR